MNNMSPSNIFNATVGGILFFLGSVSCAQIETSSSAAISSEGGTTKSEISTELITKTVNTFKLTDDKRIENKKLPMRFKLVHGNSYPVCKEYVDMLNAAKYMGYPACERKILPEFTQFKALEWKVITDEAEIERVGERNLAIAYASQGKLNQAGHRNAIKGFRRNLLKNEVRRFYTEFDIDKDGSPEIIYRSVRTYPQAADYNQCTTQFGYGIDDKTITLENAQRYREKKYHLFTASDDDSLFIKNNEIYSEQWTGGNGAYYIFIGKLGSKKLDVECGINVI